ncbi:MAG: hypothetical protein MZV70_68820 [Desulfobacterales bacterium]|nr:hypothetical protein [Desulfobacterales bacterium]
MGQAELHRLLGRLRKGDVVLVWRLDRLSPVSKGRIESDGENRSGLGLISAA